MAPKPTSPNVDEARPLWRSLPNIARLLFCIGFRELLFCSRRFLAKFVYPYEEWKEYYCEKDGGYSHWHLYLEESPQGRDENCEGCDQSDHKPRRNVSKRVMQRRPNVILPRFHAFPCI
jgi:hypothetical protein